MAVSSALVDTNVLLTATTPARPLHRQSLVVLDAWPNRGIRLWTSPQVLREYLVVATRPHDVNGLGLAVAQAVDNMRRIHRRMRLAAETERSVELLSALMLDHGISGKAIHDANLVALALTHGIASIVTANLGDFQRYSSLLSILDLASID